MPLLSATFSESDVRVAVRRWVKSLALGDFDAAAGMLVPVGHVAYSATQLKDAIGMYSRKYREAKSDAQRDALIPPVTDPSALDPGGETLRIYPPGASGAFEVEYDMPLDGKWSDLTAQFTFQPSGEGYLVGLYDIHVL